MTIKEFYEWAQKNDCENYDVLITYRDEYHSLHYYKLNEDDFFLNRTVEVIEI